MVITDQTMPGMTGVELVEKILNIRKNIPIILCTGYSSMIDEEKAAGLGINALIHKPLEYRKLAVKIREILEEKKQTEGGV